MALIISPSLPRRCPPTMIRQPEGRNHTGLIHRPSGSSGWSTNPSKGSIKTAWLPPDHRGLFHPIWTSPMELSALKSLKNPTFYQPTQSILFFLLPSNICVPGNCSLNAMSRPFVSLKGGVKLLSRCNVLSFFIDLALELIKKKGKM